MSPETIAIRSTGEALQFIQQVTSNPKMMESRRNQELYLAISDEFTKQSTTLQQELDQYYNPRLRFLNRSCLLNKNVLHVLNILANLACIGSVCAVVLNLIYGENLDFKDHLVLIIALVAMALLVPTTRLKEIANETRAELGDIEAERQAKRLERLMLFLGNLQCNQAFFNNRHDASEGQSALQRCVTQRQALQQQAPSSEYNQALPPVDAMVPTYVSAMPNHPLKKVVDGLYATAASRRARSERSLDTRSMELVPLKRPSATDSLLYDNDGDVTMAAGNDRSRIDLMAEPKQIDPEEESRLFTQNFQQLDDFCKTLNCVLPVLKVRGIVITRDLLGQANLPFTPGPQKALTLAPSTDVLPVVIHDNGDTKESTDKKA